MKIHDNAFREKGFFRVRKGLSQKPFFFLSHSNKFRRFMIMSLYNHIYLPQKLLLLASTISLSFPHSLLLSLSLPLSLSLSLTLTDTLSPLTSYVKTSCSTKHVHSFFFSLSMYTCSLSLSPLILCQFSLSVLYHKSHYFGHTHPHSITLHSLIHTVYFR